MMVRSSTDLPPPDAPTRPRISPAPHVEREVIEHDVLAEADHEVMHRDGVSVGPSVHSHIPIEAKKMANTPSRTITRKIDLTTEVVVCSPSDSALPLTRRPSLHATAPIISAMNGALIRPTSKCVTETASCRRSMKIAGHPAIEPRHQPAAIERGHGAQECQDRQRDDQGQNARQDQDVDRIETHGAQGVDLLAHLHRAEFGGIGAAGAAGHHDGDDQHADFAQDEDADHVDHIGFGAELAEMEDALLGDDAPIRKVISTMIGIACQPTR